MATLSSPVSPGDDGISANMETDENIEVGILKRQNSYYGRLLVAQGSSRLADWMGADDWPVCRSPQNALPLERHVA